MTKEKDPKNYVFLQDILQMESTDLKDENLQEYIFNKFLSWNCFEPVEKSEM